MRRELCSMREVYYQDMLKNYRKEPRDENWQHIEAKLREDKIKMNIKSKFDNFSVTPASANWDSIESRLTEPVYQNSKVNYGLRIAAGVCFILLALTFSSDKKQTTYNDIFEGFAMADAVDYDLCQDPELIELDIVKIKPVIKKPRKRSKKAKSNSKQKRLLDFILAVDEDIAATVDSALIADLIKPAEILSEENMYATTGRINPFSRDRSKYKMMYYLPEVKYNLEMPADSMDSIMFKTIRP